MSSYLRSQKAALGRNARMLAAQPVYRIASEQRLPAPSLFWRALLEQVIEDLSLNPATVTDEGAVDCSRSTDTSPRNDSSYAKAPLVGRIGRKCASFPDYTRCALRKLGWDARVNLSDDRLDEYQRNFAAHERQLHEFFHLRCCLAPCIESLIVLDRLLFLLEQDSVEDAFICPLFDPVKSPRCYALIAIRR